MAKVNWIPLFGFLLVVFGCGVAQIIFDDQESFIEPTKSVDRNVKDLLLSKFASIEYKIDEFLKEIKGKITNDLESNMLLNVNKRVSKMEDEMGILRDSYALKEENEQELITNITYMLDSNMNSSFKEIGFLINASFHFLDEKMSGLAKNLKIKIDRSESKIAELGNNISILRFEFEDTLNTSLESLQMKIGKSKNVLQKSYASALNNSASMTQQLKSYFDEKLSLSLTNITNLIQITNDRLDNESYNNIIILSTFEQRMQNFKTEEIELITNITETLDSKMNSKFLETSLSMNSSFVLVDEKISSLTESMKVKIDQSNSKTSEIGQNVSSFQSEFEDKLNSSLASLRLEIISKEENLHKRISMSANNSLKLIQQLETLFHEKLSSSSANITSLIQITNDRLDLESYNNSVTLSSLEQKMQDFKIEQMGLITNITETLDSKMNSKFLETSLSMNSSFVLVDEKLSSLTESMKVKIDQSESKTSEIGQNVSSFQSEFEDKLNSSLASLQLEIITKEENLHKSISMSANNSLKLIQQLETLFHEKLSSSSANITSLIQITNDRLDLESYNNSVTLSSLEQKMQDFKIEQMGLITNITETLDSKMNSKFLETSLSMNSSFVLVDEKISSLTESMKVKIDQSESKTSEIGQNVSSFQSEFEDKLNSSLASLRLEIISKEENLHKSISMSANNSLKLIQQLETLFHEKLSSSSANITSLIQITNDRLDLESYNNSITLSSLEQKMHDIKIEEMGLITNFTERLDSKMNSKFLEISTSVNSSFVLVDEKISSLTESMKVKIDQSESKIAEIGRNISISHTNFEEEFNKSLASIRMEIMATEENFQRSVTVSVINSQKSILQLETYLYETLSSSMNNITTMIQTTDKRVELESHINNLTISSFQRKLNTLQGEKVDLEDEIMSAKTNLSVLKSQCTVRWETIQYQLSENYKEFSTKIKETRKDNEKILSIFANNLSDVLAMQQDIFENVSNISSEVKQIKLRTILNIENHGMEANKTAEQVLQFRSDLKSCNRRIETLEKLQNVLGVQNNITFEQMGLIERNLSIWNEQLQTAINLNDEVKAQKYITNLELSRVTARISNIQNTIRGFETYHTNQNSRLGTIERRQSNISSTISEIKTALNHAGIIRLSSGGRTSGRVEVYYNGMWGTVCDDSWDSTDAYVACRMLGLSGGTARSSAYYGRGSGPIWLDDLQCGGSESSLFACNGRPVGSHNCGHGEDAGVSCS